MRTVKAWKGMTAKGIIHGKDGETKGGDNMTGDIIWNYRTDYLPDGTYDDQGPCVSSEENATCIVVDSVGGPIVRLEL